MVLNCREGGHTLTADAAASGLSTSRVSRLTAQGVTPQGSTPQELDSYIRNQMARFARIVKNTGMRVE